MEIDPYNTYVRLFFPRRVATFTSKRPGVHVPKKGEEDQERKEKIKRKIHLLLQMRLNGCLGVH